MSALTRDERAERIGDIEGDLAAGIEPRHIAESLGVRLDSLVQWLVGNGRRDLAHQLNPRVSPTRPAWMDEVAS